MIFNINEITAKANKCANCISHSFVPGESGGFGIYCVQYGHPFVKYYTVPVSGHVI